MEFDSSSYERRQSASDAAFRDFDSEFEESRPKRITPQKREASPAPQHERQAQSPSHEDRQTVTSAPPSEPQRSSQPTAYKTESSEGYEFTLKECKKVQHSVECELTVVDDEFDGNLLVYRERWGDKSQMIDNKANVYTPSKLDLKNNETSGSHLEVLTLRNVPTDIKLTFDNFSGKATEIHILKIRAYSKRVNKKFDVKFREIALLD